VTIAGATAKPATGSNPNPFFALVDAGQPQITNSDTLPKLALRPTQTVDFATTPGGIYTLTPQP
jgi:hypothetical protein